MFTYINVNMYPDFFFHFVGQDFLSFMLWQSAALIVIVLFYTCSSCMISVCNENHTRFTEQLWKWTGCFLFRQSCKKYADHGYLASFKHDTCCCLDPSCVLHGVMSFGIAVETDSRCQRTADESFHSGKLPSKFLLETCQLAFYQC